MTYSSWRSAYCPDPRLFQHACLARWNEGCLFWVYMGHGHRHRLAPLRTPLGAFPSLSSDDAAKLQAAEAPPITVLLACYAGAFDGDDDCLAEEYLRAPGGGIGVLAASRVTMPYAMSVLGSALLEEVFSGRHATLGEVVQAAQCQLGREAPQPAAKRANEVAPEPSQRAMLDAVARVISPAPEELHLERREHVQLFNLLGDPLLRLPLPEAIGVSAPDRARANQEIELAIDTPLAGECVVELVCRRDRLTFRPPVRARLSANEAELQQMLATYVRANDPRWTSQRHHHAGGESRLPLTIPSEANGHCFVRVFLAGDQQAAIGAAPIYVFPED